MKSIMSLCNGSLGVFPLRGYSQLHFLRLRTCRDCWYAAVAKAGLIRIGSTSEVLCFTFKLSVHEKNETYLFSVYMNKEKYPYQAPFIQLLKNGTFFCSIAMFLDNQTYAQTKYISSNGYIDQFYTTVPCGVCLCSCCQ